MVHMKKKSSDNEDVVKKFLGLLAQQLLRENEDGKSVLESSNLKEVLRRATEDLPAGKLRSTLLQQVDFSVFVVDLQDAIKATRATATCSVSIQNEGPPISIDSSGKPLSEESSWKKVASECSNGEQAEELCAEVGCRFLSRRDLPLNVLWSIGAQSICRDGNEDKTSSALLSTKALLRRLKPLIVGHTTANTAVAALAPVAVVVFQAVQESSKPLPLSVGERASIDTTLLMKRAQKHIKTLQTMVREVLSFIVVCRSKKRSSTNASSPTSGPRLSDLLNGFSCLLRSVKLEEILARSDVLAVTERLKPLFPFFPYSMVKALKRPHVNVDKLSEMVTVEFVVIQLILEAIKWRNKMKMHAGKMDALHESFTTRMRTIAVQGVAAADRRNDVILDLLLSGLSVDNELLDDKEKGLISELLYRALLVEDSQFDDTTMVTASTSKTKMFKTFLKKVAVARITNDSFRSVNEQNQSFHLLCRLHMPPELVQWLKTAKIKQKPPENAALNSPRILMGWLLNLDDMDFKEILSSASSFASKRLWDQQEQISEKDDLPNVGQISKGGDLSEVGEDDENNTSARDVHGQTQQEALFFVDTLGEAGRKSPVGNKTTAIVSAGKEIQESKKRRFCFTGAELAYGREYERQ